jgi:hypothetical protein
MLRSWFYLSSKVPASKCEALSSNSNTVKKKKKRKKGEKDIQHLMAKRICL